MVSIKLLVHLDEKQKYKETYKTTSEMKKKCKQKKISHTNAFNGETTMEKKVACVKKSCVRFFFSNEMTLK